MYLSTLASSYPAIPATALNSVIIGVVTLAPPTSGQRQLRHRMQELPSIVMVTDH